MKAISLLQPWASLMVLGLKEIETRSWQRGYRGELAIHASKRIIPFDQVFGYLSFDQRTFLMVRFCEKYGDYSKLPTGSILAITDLLDIVPVERVRDNLSWIEKACGDYSDKRFAWMTKNIKELEVPVPIKGQLGLWNWERK